MTLLCLQTTTGEELAWTTATQRTALADRVDPRDEFMASEVWSATPTAEVLEYVDDLVEASYGGAEALTRVGADRQRNPWPVG